MTHGWLIVDKPVGPGSTRIVGAVKRALHEGGYAKVKVGHGGTLDPLASGVLPIALGEATKLSGRMLDADKVYEFTIGFGVETDTLDMEGEAVSTSDVRPSLAEVEAVLTRFTGEIEQVPPAYSALKVEGKRAYDLARAGEAVEMKARSVTVHELQIKKEEDPHPNLLPQAGEGAHRRTSRTSPSPACGRGQGEGLLLPSTPLISVTLIATVSKGTYIRSLARDIARALGTVGHVTMLRRTRAGPFTLERAISLDKLADLAKARRLEQALLPLTAGLDDIPALPVTPDQASRLRQGRTLAGIAAKPGLHLATDESVPVALVELSEGELRVVRGFNL
ncbi:MAG TPA: tRNA pseudouridine(55) synthase TruB [Allosphingosinicella sp.]|nr:tRNA pseudouridine(55) synthase TruB [Allosphingosinicella sp.]